MSFSIGITDYLGSGKNVTLADQPDRCPVCHHSIDPRRAGGASTDGTATSIQIVFQCMRNACRALFIGTYDYKPTNGRYYLASVAPISPEPAVVPEEVASVSPMFVTVYNQALAAEAAGLDQLTGIGLRKALEFLVKDFCVNQHASEAETIKKTTLGSCISTYLADPNLKSTAKRATWLGNDETHYVRKWETKDIKDLKLLIKLVTNWTQNVLLTKQYESDMPDGQPGV